MYATYAPCGSERDPASWEKVIDSPDVSFPEEVQVLQCYLSSSFQNTIAIYIIFIFNVLYKYHSSAS